MNDCSKTIMWADKTWNPVIGCKHGCEYCYARKISVRFGDGAFEPDIHPHRFDEPAKRKKPAKIFVVSMGDLFGEWVPDEWIEQVFTACEAAPQHTYYFLTKNPRRYDLLAEHFEGKRNWYAGYSATNEHDYFEGMKPIDLRPSQVYCSLEPLQERIESLIIQLDAPVPVDPVAWIIVGQETGNRKGKIKVKRQWILDIRKQCAKLKIPLFEKNSLDGLDLPGGLIQQWPAAK